MTFVTPRMIQEEIPLTPAHQISIEGWRQDLSNILQASDSHQDAKIALIVGPCSIHNIEAAREYAQKLKVLSLEVADVFFIIMRAYFEKPRTLSGWKGLLYDPSLDGSHDIINGIRLSRSFLSELTDMGLAAATEFLDPLASYFLSDFITWGSIGARTSQSQIHRQLASALVMPIGFKNRPDGNIESAIQAILSAQSPHSFLGIDPDGRICKATSSGNPSAHLVLRGGETKTNYDLSSINYALELLEKANLAKMVIVDCSHDNCKKNHRQQTRIFSFLIDQITKGLRSVRGIMLESFLMEANQATYKLCSQESAKKTSLTDPCLDWETTEELILQAAELLRSQKSTFAVSGRSL